MSARTDSRALRGSRMALAIALIACAVAPARAALTLAGDDAPTDPPWDKPATLDYVRSNGSASSTIDAQLDYKTESLEKAADGDVKTGFRFGAFIHKDTAADSLKNDRGLSVGYTRFMLPDKSGSANFLYNSTLSAKLKFGKSLQEVKDDAGIVTHPDKTTDRQTLLLSGYLEPKSSIPATEVPDRYPKFFVTADTGLYSDHASGSDKGSGRLSGGLVDVAFNLAPLGIDPPSNTYGSLTVIPLLYATAQVEKDFASSGDRNQSTYRLFSVGLTLTFGKVKDSSHALVPSLNIERSTGADLLAGRSRSAKTEIAFGLSF